MKITNIEPEQSERKAEFLSLLRSLGGIATEEIDYGFIITLNGILVDCEPCVRMGCTNLRGWH